MKTLVLIDDDAEFLSWLETGLKLKGNYTVFTALDGTKGWALLQAKKPDLAIIDIKLPDIQL